MRTLFLDYDGVLHPNEVYLTREKNGQNVLKLKMDCHDLFEHAERLVELLEPHEEINIVLSTSWVHVFSFNKAKGYLPKSLQEKVRGSTYHSSVQRDFWESLTRYQQIARYVQRHGLTDWIAIDDNGLGWPEDKHHHLVHTNEWGGLGDTAAQEKLAAWLLDTHNKKMVAPNEKLA